MTRPLALACALAAAAPARADITLLGTAALPADTADLSGLDGTLADGTPRNRLGGLSGIAYTGRGDEYLHVSDRGPKDGATDYPCRFHRMTVRVDPKATPAVSLKLTGTTLLADERGRPFVGALGALDPKGPHRLDPEGVRVGRRGEVYLADEYGPFLAAFDAAGKRTRALPVPARFRAAKPAADPKAELAANPTGRIPNRGMEGLAISPDGAKLYGIMQSPLVQDNKGEPDKDGKVTWAGRNVRILEVDLGTNATREFVYQLDDPANGVNEILAVNDREFLVLERDGKPGTDARYKRLAHIDLTGATDVSGIDALPVGDLPAAITPAKKKPFLDLLDPKFGIAGPDCPEKFEGIAFGPDLPDGRRLLLLTADNDFLPDQPFRVYAFAIDKADLPGLVHQQFDPQK